jgi:hypothetical protein
MTYLEVISLTPSAERGSLSIRRSVLAQEPATRAGTRRQAAQVAVRALAR